MAQPAPLFDKCSTCGGKGTTPYAYGEQLCRACKGTGVAEPDGETYQRDIDGPRLTGQNRAVFELMKDRKWRTLEEIAEQLTKPITTQSVSARLRDLRKEKFGSHEVERERIGSGVFRYRLLPRDLRQA